MEGIKDCQAKLILTRSYDSKAKIVTYRCKDYNGTTREIIVDVKGESVEDIIRMDQMILNSFSDQCHNCPNHR